MVKQLLSIDLSAFHCIASGRKVKGIAKDHLGNWGFTLCHILLLCTSISTPCLSSLAF